MPYHFRLQRPGFTLIELLIVISIMSLIGGLGFVSLRDFSENQTVAQAADDIVSSLQLARSSAQTQVKPQTCNTTTTLDGYRVRFTCGGSSCSSYSVLPICSNQERTAVSTKQFASGVTVTTGSQSLTFQTITGTVTLSQNPTIIRVIGSRESATVTVYPDGRIVKS